MKCKFFAVAALLFYNASFSATPVPANEALCRSAPSTPLGLTNFCAPEAVVNVMGSSSLSGAMLTLLAMRDNPVFDTGRPIARIYSNDSALTARSALETGWGPLNTIIFYGYGRDGYDKTTNPYGGKRLAVILNTASGGFTGLNAMVNTRKNANQLATGTANRGVYFNETITTKLLTESDTVSQSCTGGTERVSITGAESAAFHVNCSSGWDRKWSRDYVNEIPAGSKNPRSVQLVTLDVLPEFAPPGAVSAEFKNVKLHISEAAVQGYGIVVNDKLLTALIERDVANKSLPSSCNSVTGYVTLTPDCQPSIALTEVAQFANGQGSAAKLFGAADTTPVVYYRRTAVTGGQSVSQVVFGSLGASLAFNKELKNYSPVFYKNPVLGEMDADGRYQWTGQGLTVNTALTAGDLLDGVGATANANVYALGLVSLGRGRSLDGRIGGRLGASWVKVDGISPNSDGTNWDPKLRVGFARAYPLQFNVIAAYNAANKNLGQIKVVDALINAMKDPVYDIQGVAYLDASAVTSAGKNNWAKYTRSINAYAPLSLNK